MKKLKDKLVSQSLFGNGFNLDLKEIPPSMLLDYNITLIKIWKIVRDFELNFYSPKTKMLSIRFDGSIILNNLNDVTSKLKNSSCLNVYFKYFVNKLFVISKYPDLVYLFNRASFVDSYEFLHIASFLKYICPKPILKKLSRSKIAPLLVMNSYITILNTYLFKKKTQDWFIDKTLNLINQNINLIKLQNLSGVWTNYYDKINLTKFITFPKQKLQKELDYRQKCIFKILNKQNSSQVLDIASNKGLFSILAARAGHNVLSVDNDIGAIDFLYNLKKKYSLKIIPSILDFNEFKSETFQKYRSPFVLALGFTHHLYLVEKISWEEISLKLSKLTETALITEFKINTAAIGSENNISNKWAISYKIEIFIKNLNKYFKDIHVINSKDKNVRKIILCYK